MTNLPNYSENTPERTQRIAELNDILRTTFLPCFGRVVMTEGIQALGETMVSEAVEAVQRFSDFTGDNDPYHEHDFGSCELCNGTTIFWKVDYLDINYRYASEDPSDPNVTKRVLTIMLSSEY